MTDASIRAFDEALRTKREVKVTLAATLHYARPVRRTADRLFLHERGNIKQVIAVYTDRPDASIVLAGAA